MASANSSPVAPAAALRPLQLLFLAQLIVESASGSPTPHPGLPSRSAVYQSPPDFQPTILTRRQSFPPPTPPSHSLSIVIILPILLGVALLITSLCTLRWHMMRGVDVSSPASGAHDAEMFMATLSPGDTMVVPLPVYEPPARGRAMIEARLVGAENRRDCGRQGTMQAHQERNEQHGALALPPPAYHTGTRDEHGFDLSDVGKRMHAARCA